MGKVVRFAPRGASRKLVPDPRNGTVEIYPSDAMGGSWAVYHVSQSGGSVGHCGDFFDRADAEKAAQAEASRRGALYDDGAPVA